jgi:hypothetical protein
MPLAQVAIINPNPITMRLPGQPDVNATFSWVGPLPPVLFYLAYPLVLYNLTGVPALDMVRLNGCSFSVSSKYTVNNLVGVYPLLQKDAVMTVTTGPLLGYTGTVGADQCAGTGLLLS